jgi:hypothetical protein
MIKVLYSLDLLMDEVGWLVKLLSFTFSVNQIWILLEEFAISSVLCHGVCLLLQFCGYQIRCISS